MRCDSFWMISMYLSVFSGESADTMMMSLIIMIEVSGFLISCTIPEPMRPISASFSDWMSTSRMRFFSVRSCEIAEVPTTVPVESRIAEKAISTGIARAVLPREGDLDAPGLDPGRRTVRERLRNRLARLGWQQERPVPPEGLRLASSRRGAPRRCSSWTRARTGRS